jgi:hypothetical protein
MQFFIISPPILWAYHRFHRLVGWAASACLLIIHITCTAWIVNHFSINVVSVHNGMAFGAYYYQKPYCRVGPYVIGILAGLIFFSYRHHKATGEVYDPIAFFVADWIRNSRIVRYVGLLLGLFFINFPIWI